MIGARNPTETRTSSSPSKRPSSDSEFSMTKRFPPPSWNKPVQADKGYPIHAGTPLGPRSERPPSDVLMIGSTPKTNKRSSNEVSSSTKKRKTTEREEVLKKKLKAGKNSSGRSRNNKASPKKSRPPRTPTKKTPLKPIPAPESATSSQSSETRSSRQWHTPPPLPSDSEMLSAMGRSAYDNVQQELLKAKRMRSSSQNDEKENHSPIDSLWLSIAPTQLPHIRTVHDETHHPELNPAIATASSCLELPTLPLLISSTTGSKTAEWYRRSKDRAEADSGYKFKVAICPAYDIYGDLCKANRCVNGKRCNFAHPDDEEWPGLVSRGIAKVRMNLACPHYNELGEPVSKGGCPQREYCPLYHPWHPKWLKLRGNGCMKIPAYIKCKHFDCHGRTITKSGCWHRKNGDCSYVHPDSKYWHRAVCVTPCPDNDPEYYKEPVRGKGVIRLPHYPSWLKALPWQPGPTGEASPCPSVDPYRAVSDRFETDLRTAKPATSSKRQTSVEDVTGQWVSHIREGIIADAGYALARNDLARHDALLASGAAVPSDPVVIAESRTLTGQAIACRESLDNALQDVQGSSAQFFAAFDPHIDDLLKRISSLENSTRSSAHSHDNNCSERHIAVGQRLQALETSAAQHDRDTLSLFDCVDDHSRALRSRKHLSERVYDLEDNLKDLKAARRKERQAAADQMLSLSWDIRESRRIKASETDALKKQIKRELIAEFGAYLQPTRDIAIVHHYNSQPIRPLSDSSFAEGDMTRESE